MAVPNPYHVHITMFKHYHIQALPWSNITMAEPQ